MPPSIAFMYTANASGSSVMWNEPLHTGELPLPGMLLDGLQAHTLVADVVTKPEITPLLERARALAGISGDYQTYSGLDAAMDGSVKFIYRTEAIG